MSEKKRKKLGLGRSTWLHIRRSPFQSLAAAMVMGLNFTMATILIVLVFGFSALLSYFESRPEVSAFLKDSVGEVKIQQLREDLTKVEGVKEVRFVSKEEALKIYQEQNKDNPLLLEMVNASILPASLEISAVDPGYLNEVAEFLKKETAVVEEVVFQKDVVEKLSFWVRNIKNGGIVVAGFLSLVSLAVIIIILGMKIAVNRDEINALRSLGAGNFYIQGPFLLEGLFYGVIGAILGLTLIFGSLFSQQGRIESFFSPISVFPQNQLTIILIFASEILAGAILGLIAAWLATQRYLKR